MPPKGRKPAVDESTNGVVAIDKPVGPTSHDIVDAVRRIYNVRRVGHTGTLDPGASGLLIVLVGRATKVANFLTGLDKTYLATIRFGSTSDTGDADGTLTPGGDPSSLTEAKLLPIVEDLKSLRTQDVPAYAAVRSNGRRRYEIARGGDEVPPLERTITVYHSELIAFAGESAILRVRCSSGTYVRSLAEYIGRIAGCGAYLAALRREQIGTWNVRDARSLDSLQSAKEKGQTPNPDAVESFLPFPRVMLGDDAIVGVGHGKPVHPRHIRGITGEFTDGDIIALADGSGRVVAIADALVGSSSVQAAGSTQEICRYRRVLIG